MDMDMDKGRCLSANDEVERLISELSEDRERIEDNVERLPDEIKAHISTEVFGATALEKFQALDLNQDGKLSVQELFPAVTELLEPEPMTESCCCSYAVDAGLL